MFILKNTIEYLVNLLFIIILGITLSINDTDKNQRVKSILGLYDVTINATA